MRRAELDAVATMTVHRGDPEGRSGGGAV